MGKGQSCILKKSATYKIGTLVSAAVAEVIRLLLANQKILLCNVFTLDATYFQLTEQNLHR